MYRDIPEELRILIEPVVVDAGLELVDVMLARSGRPWSLRVTVDTPVGDGRVPVDHCARVAREIGTQLDVTDAIESSYRLEVSSPGLDRVLTREKDFVNACGSEVQIETRIPISGRRRFRGVLVSFENNVANINVDGVESKLPISEIFKAKLFYEFSAADFNGRDDHPRDEPKSGRKTTGGRHGKRNENKSGGRRGHSDECGGKTAGRASGRIAEIDG